MLVSHGPPWAEGAVPPAMVCAPGTSWRCGSQSFLWGSGNRTLDLMGHCFKCCIAALILQCLLQALRCIFSKKTFLFHKICYAFHLKYAACGNHVHGLLVEVANAKGTAVALYSSSHLSSLWSPVCSSQPSFPACAKIFSWGRVDFGLKSPKSLAF